MNSNSKFIEAVLLHKLQNCCFEITQPHVRAAAMHMIGKNEEVTR